MRGTLMDIFVFFPFPLFFLSMLLTGEGGFLKNMGIGSYII